MHGWRPEKWGGWSVDNAALGLVGVILHRARPAAAITRHPYVERIPQEEASIVLGSRTGRFHGEFALPERVVAVGAGLCFYLNVLSYRRRAITAASFTRAAPCICVILLSCRLFLILLSSPIHFAGRFTSPTSSFYS